MSCQILIIIFHNFYYNSFMLKVKIIGLFLIYNYILLTWTGINLKRKCL